MNDSYQEDKDRSRVRAQLHELVNSKWEDKGTAFCFVRTASEGKAHFFAHAESDLSHVLLMTTIDSDSMFRLQQACTTIVWIAPNGVQHALTFECPERCTEVFSCISAELHRFDIEDKIQEAREYQKVAEDNAKKEAELEETYLWEQACREYEAKRIRDIRKADCALALCDLLSEQADLCDCEATAAGQSNPSFASAPSSSKSTGSQDCQTLPWQSLNPTLSSWKKLMKRLSTAISHVEELAGTAPAEHQASLQAQIVELHNALKRHQDRYEEFVKLSQEYAEQYLRDLSDEIRSQSAWLVLLERRLELAKTLRTDALDLKTSFEKGVCKELKGVRAAVRACPLADESDLLNELDTLISAIKACYVELDKFWADEVGHVTQALKEHRIERGEVDRWRKIEITLEGILDGGTMKTPASETLPSLRPPVGLVKPAHQVKMPRPSVSTVSDPSAQLGLPTIAVILIPAIHTIQTSLLSARSFNRHIFSVLKPKHLQSLQRAHFNVSQQNKRCLRFFGDCVSYARKAAESACAALSPATFPRVTAAFGLRERATALIRTCHLTGSVDVPETAGSKVCKAFRELGAMLRDADCLWRAIVDDDMHVFASLVRGEEKLFVLGCSTKQLMKLLGRMDGEKSVLQRFSVASW
ncbi:hypothetical protein FA95DRAFT_1613571 [Auriscalpium vulgare]|uniref:Uncharacterized protein n=1 Tax=Auriscalpium vulgare TaxID=40419 RepID=A0ACB8R2S4_9AGAM|nr:hypothetical protein FA95DRAFT_1613571 [Auriscalpium vulgare]